MCFTCLINLFQLKIRKENVCFLPWVRILTKSAKYRPRIEVNFFASRPSRPVQGILKGLLSNFGFVSYCSNKISWISQVHRTNNFSLWQILLALYPFPNSCLWTLNMWLSEGFQMLFIIYVNMGNRFFWRYLHLIYYLQYHWHSLFGLGYEIWKEIFSQICPNFLISHGSSSAVALYHINCNCSVLKLIIW